ncbi:3732_t:CDS:1, partial [Racocetra fulgida]
RLNPNKKFTLSGVILFELDLECLETCQDNSDRQLKPYLHLKSELQKSYCLKQLASDIYFCSKKLLEEHQFFDTNLDYIELKVLNEQ